MSEKFESAGMAGAVAAASERLASVANVKIPSDRGEQLRVIMQDATSHQSANELRATISHLTAELERCREAFRAITKIEFAGSCCGCSSDDSFDEVQAIARAALRSLEERE